MKKHSFNFDGGDYLNNMGAAWFVSYSWYDNVDSAHLNWKKVSTYKNRVSTYKRTQSYHNYWLRQIICMNETNLDKNTIGLSGREIIEKANKLLQ